MIEKSKNKGEALGGPPLPCTTGHTHLEFLVSPQDLRAQREVMHRALLIVVYDVRFAILILALVGCLCPRLSLSLSRRLRAWRLCQFYALQQTVLSSQRSRYNQLGRRKERGYGEGERRIESELGDHQLTVWIQKPGSGETMSIRRDCEWTLSQASSGTNILMFQ
jgi:hypothetical protein